MLLKIFVQKQVSRTPGFQGDFWRAEWFNFLYDYSDLGVFSLLIEDLYRF